MRTIEAWMEETDFERGFERKQGPKYDRELSIYGADWSDVPKYEGGEPSVRVVVMRASDFEKLKTGVRESTTDPDAGLEERRRDEAVRAFEELTTGAERKRLYYWPHDPGVFLTTAQAIAIRDTLAALRERAERAERERDHWTVEHAKATAALEQWKCSRCYGEGNMYGAFGKAEVCAICKGSGLDPIASRALSVSPAPEVRDG